MNILYVNPSKLSSGLDSVIQAIPLGLLSIAAMVPEHPAKIFDFKIEKAEDFPPFLEWADIVAITSMTPQIESALEIAIMAKAQNKITIIGGYHPSLEPEYCASHPGIDYCVRGEGEHTFRELIDFINGNKIGIHKQDILGISYKDSTGKVIHNAPRPLEPNLDNFPIPRRDLIAHNQKKYSYLGTHVMLMETSRGCPMNCNFCCIIKMWDDGSNKMRYRTKSLKRVMEELYSIEPFYDFVFFCDDNFSINIKRAEKIVDMLIKSRMSHRFFYSCQTRVDTIYRYPELVKKFYSAGFRQFFLGIESMHQQSLDGMGKHTNIEMIRKAVKITNDAGISIFGGMIIGFPGETVKMVRDNINFAISLGLDFVQFTPITAFPGTKFFTEMKEQGKIATFDWKYYNLFHSMMRTDQLSRIEMYRLVGEAYSKYYLNAEFLIMMTKRMLRKEFHWFFKIAPKWIKQFVLGGMHMLNSMGMSFELVARDPNYYSGKIIRGFDSERETLRSRFESYKLKSFYLIRLRVLKEKHEKMMKKTLIPAKI